MQLNMSRDEAETYLADLEAEERENRETRRAARIAGDLQALAVCARNAAILRNEIKFAKADLEAS